MRRLTRFLIIPLAALALPAYAAKGRDQSYITFDDGGTIVRQGDDNREVEGRVNFPIYPGDEVTTGPRGRTEIRLADGNIIALDRATTVRFRSIYDSYESDSAQSIIELKSGHVAVQRTAEATEMLRIDTANASYAANDEATYGLETDAQGRDRVTVYDGEIDVRTPQRSTNVREGEEARVDDQGMYGLVRSNVSDDFERWFTRRAQRYQTASSRYLDRPLAYSDYQLQDYGSWVFVSSYGGYCWRPRVAVGWRPYYYGNWGYGPDGCLTWISSEPWGWVPYHYGRWGYDPLYGWLWLPGYAYAPAWVYWAYGPGYIGWAPAGWYDCYRPYYSWAYQPYSRAGLGFGFGFYGHVRLNEVDLRPWTFVNPNRIVSTRVDQAAITTDAIRQRLIREPGSALATVSGSPARFTRSDLKDPATAVGNIIRRGPVGGAARESSGTTDLTPFFRRDAQISTAVRERVAAERFASPPPPPSTIGVPSGVPSPGTRGTLEGRTDKDGTGARGDYRPGEANGRVYRDPYGGTSNSGNSAGGRAATAPRNGHESSTPDRGWRDRVDRSAPSPSTPPATNLRPPSDTNWRGRSVERGSGNNNSNSGDSNRADIPRRIIDRIGGARITSGDTNRDSTPRESTSRDSQPRDSTPRESSPPRESQPRSSEPPRQERPSSPPPSHDHSSSPPPRQEHSSPPSHDSGGGGRLKRG